MKSSPTNLALFTAHRSYDRRIAKDKGNELLSSVDELAEFYDPYSDLNLFLAQKIAQEMRHCGNSKKWSLKLQEELLQRITPEFQKRFPHYRLGVAALKKTWEKVSYYAQQIQEQKEAMTQDGKLNIHFFIRENLKQCISLKHPNPLHPSHFAHQLGMKMGECIACIEGVRPKLDQLTRLIWSVQRHLLCELPVEKAPYDEYDKLDKLIIKTLLEITHKETQCGHNELAYQVQEKLLSLRELPSFASLESITGNVSALLAEKLYSASRFHDLFLAEQKSAIINFIRRHSALCKMGIGAMSLTDLVRRIMALYALASGLPKNLSDEEINSAVRASYPITSSQRPDLPQALYAFLAAELLLMRHTQYCHCPAFVSNTILSAYKEAVLLPEFKTDQMDMLEIVIWKTLSDMEGLLEKLPYKNGLRIEEEIANILIENPQKNFSALVQDTVQLFKRTKELIDSKKASQLEVKIHMWVIQGDMLYRAIHLDQDTPLMQLIKSQWEKRQNPIAHDLFVSIICQEYLKQYPELTLYAKQLTQRVWILYKYAWYSLFASKKESSYMRFLKWHALCFFANSPHCSEEQCIDKLEEVVTKTLPLVPFERKQCQEACKSALYNRSLA